MTRTIEATFQFTVPDWVQSEQAYTSWLEYIEDSLEEDFAPPPRLISHTLFRFARTANPRTPTKYPSLGSPPEDFGHEDCEVCNQARNNPT